MVGAEPGGPAHGEKELIGDRELESIRTLDSRKSETPNPDSESGKSHGKCRGRDRVSERTYGSGFSRDSSRGSKELIQLAEGND
jgi:hypothetical protein